MPEHASTQFGLVDTRTHPHGIHCDPFSKLSQPQYTYDTHMSVGWGERPVVHLHSKLGIFMYQEETTSQPQPPLHL
jgi:hypothetical protein